jgi:hypothetical protein
VLHEGRIHVAERAVVSEYWDDSEEFRTEASGHASRFVEA